jgi:methylenetetrahydrofolate dehydrogenase (NADP+)/methenyltetrahydrofolate cyclohydrolase
MATLLDGDAVASTIIDETRAAVEDLVASGVRPRLATVDMEETAASETYTTLHHRDCEEVGIETELRSLSSGASQADLHQEIEDLNADDSVHGVLVQSDVPEHIDWQDAIECIGPMKDVEGVHPANMGRVVADRPRYKPCTPAGIQRLLSEEGVPITGADVVVVNHSYIVGKPLANLLLADREDGNATVTVCHEWTTDLAEKTRRADILVVAVGKPGFLDGSMVSEGTTVVDVGMTSVERDGETTLVGDVEFESVEPKADYITPVPGGVGPMTRAMLVSNAADAARLQSRAPVETAESR